MLCLCYGCYKKIYNNNIKREAAEMSDIKLICQCCGRKRNIVVNIRKVNLESKKRNSLDFYI